MVICLIGDVYRSTQLLNGSGMAHVYEVGIYIARFATRLFNFNSPADHRRNPWERGYRERTRENSCCVHTYGSVWAVGVEGIGWEGIKKNIIII